MKSKIKKLKKENFIRIAPGQYFDLLEYCGYYKKSMIETPPLYHNANTLILADLYDALKRKEERWKYYPIPAYRVFRLRYVEYFVLADELLNFCPTYELNDVLDRLDKMFLNYYDFSLKEKFQIDSKN